MRERSICRRFETERRDAYDNDPSFADHLKRCKDCRAIRSAHLRIARTIRLMHDSATPSAGWRERVLEKIADIEAAADRSSEDRASLLPAAPQSETGQRRRRAAGET
jgi:hypothetical protein